MLMATNNAPNSKKRKLDEIKSLDSKDEAHLKHTESSIITLNVGGGYFTTTKQTLLNIVDSYFAKRFGGQFSMAPQLKDGAYFIDRDPTYFRLILNFLRDGIVILPNNEKELKQLDLECRFYNLCTLQKMIQSELNKIKQTILNSEPPSYYSVLDEISDSLDTIAKAIKEQNFGQTMEYGLDNIANVFKHKLADMTREIQMCAPCPPDYSVEMDYIEKSLSKIANVLTKQDNSESSSSS
eukprot:548963_1